jgi:hypothetical protein
MVQARELRASFVGVAIVAAYVAVVLASGQVEFRQFAILFSVYLGGSVALWILLGLIVMTVRTFQEARRSGKESFLGPFVINSLAARWEWDRGVSLIWPPLLFAALIASFNAYKQMVLPLAGFGFDPLLAQADRLLFLGHDGWRVTHAIFGSPGATKVIDSLYHGWFVPMTVGVVLCAWLPSSTYRLRNQYLFSYMGVWIGIGSILAFLMPSSGPCFYPELVGPHSGYESLMQRLAELQTQHGTPLTALRNQQMLLQAHGSDSIIMGGGISAMPSVHNGLSVLFALAAWKISRPLGWAFATYAAVIWIGSIHLGWHYGVDGLVAAGLTYALWIGSGRLADRLENPVLPASAEPALT